METEAASSGALAMDEVLGAAGENALVDTQRKIGGKRMVVTSGNETQSP